VVRRPRFVAPFYYRTTASFPGTAALFVRQVISSAAVTSRLSASRGATSVNVSEATRGSTAENRRREDRVLWWNPCSSNQAAPHVAGRPRTEVS
jgi:hypothetical protein